MFKITKFFWLLFLGSCLNSCPESQVIPAPPIVTDANMCKPACDRLRTLGCEEGTPVDTGNDCPASIGGCDAGTCIDGACMVTCESFCEETEKLGIWLAPECVSKITHCDEIESCAPVK